MTTAAGRPVEEILLGFTRALRSAGVPVTQDRAGTFLRAVALLGADDASGTYRAGRATLCSGPEDLHRYDQVFEAWFGQTDELPRPGRTASPRVVVAPLPIDEGEGGAEESDQESDEVVRAAASDREVLQHRDVAGLSGAEKVLLDAMIGALRPRPPVRRASRRSPWRRGEVDLHHTLRASLRQLGEPGPIHHRRRLLRPRRVVVLVDVSGSMRPYADALLRLAHVLVRMSAPGARVEAFTVGTRLTRVTAALRSADPERALARAGEEVPDWSGGTRLGEGLAAFLGRWGGLARGAVVVLFSDGWERGDGAELATQLGRLRRLAHTVVWVNPHRGKTGYLPVQAGIVAALPHLDHFLAGHSVRTFEEVLEVIADA